MNDGYDGLKQIIDEVLESMSAKATGSFGPQACNLAEFYRRTGLSRQRARMIKANGFKARPYGKLGLKPANAVPSDHAGFVDDCVPHASPVTVPRTADTSFHALEMQPNALNQCRQRLYVVRHAAGKEIPWHEPAA